jgi:pantothenate kinase-related protein Tda10
MTNSTAQTKAQLIEEKIKQLKAQHAAILAKTNKSERAKRTRQAVILGGWLMANEPQKVAQIVASLTREQDKKAFA